MTQCPAAFCLMRSFMRAFFEPKSFMANLLSVGWKRACSWLRRKPCLASVAGGAGSTGVPYRDTSSKPPKWTLPVPLPCFSDISASPATRYTYIVKLLFAALYKVQRRPHLLHTIIIKARFNKIKLVNVIFLLN